MIKKLLQVCALSIVIHAQAQAQQFIVNEIDSDNPSTDTEEFVEIKSQQPYTSLDGHVLVFYNGAASGSTASKVYYAISLDGLTTDVNGLVVIGNSGVSPTPARIIPNSTIQNGPDVIAIYQGDIEDFYQYAPVITTGLVHGVAHSNTSTQPTALMNALGITSFGNEHQFGNKETHSIQRDAEGNYVAGLPTPGMLNDGSGVQFNGLSILVDTSDKVEGTDFDITFTLQQAPTTDLAFTYTLANGAFNADDYIADLNVTIPAGQVSVVKNVQIIDDGITDGDEVLRIVVNELPEGYQTLNNMIVINIVDANFTVSNFGTPLNPTYGNVTPTFTYEYYETLNGLSGQELKEEITAIIADPTTVRKRVYADLPTFLKVTDQNPENSNQVWLMYKEEARAKNLYQLTSAGTGYWNREHIYPQSRGGFSGGTSDLPSGVDYWELSNAQDIAAAHSDPHHIRAEDAPTNSSRNNKDFGPLDYNGPQNNQGSWKGDVARALFYMALRYEVLELVDGNPDDSTANQLGDLQTLLSWHELDPADDFEMNRNNIIYSWQMNRNPFIDLPDLVDYVYGPLQNTPYQLPLSNTDVWQANFKMYPNPTDEVVYFEGLDYAHIHIYNILGQKVKSFKINNHHTESLSLPTGMYHVQIVKDGKYHTEKLMIK